MAHHSRQAASLAALIALLAVAMIFATSLDVGHRAAVAAEVVEPVVIVPAGSSRPVTLRDRLVTGLRARLKSEIDFIDRLVHAVNLGQVPQRLVDQSYFWARIRANDQRHGRPRRPIIYFQPAMTARAQRLGVVL